MRRALSLVIGGVVVLVGIGALLLVFQSRDEGEVAGAGEEEAPAVVHGKSAPAIDPDDLPTSGEHKPAALPVDVTELTGDEWLHALEQGNVILAYGTDPVPPAFERLQQELGPYDPELAAAGQSVILASVPGLADPAAVAWGQIEPFDDATEPQVREFIEARLGTGAPR